MAIEPDEKVAITDTKLSENFRKSNIFIQKIRQIGQIFV